MVWTLTLTLTRTRTLIPLVRRPAVWTYVYGLVRVMEVQGGRV